LQTQLDSPGRSLDMGSTKGPRPGPERREMRVSVGRKVQTVRHRDAEPLTSRAALEA